MYWLAVIIKFQRESNMNYIDCTKFKMFQIHLIITLLLIGCQTTQKDFTEELSINNEPLSLVTKSCTIGSVLYSQNDYISSAGTISINSGVDDPYLIHNINGTMITSSLEIESSTSISLIGFSPNGEWLALRSGSLFDDIPEKIHLLHHSGKIITTEPENLFVSSQAKASGGWAQMLWVNDDLLLVHIVVAQEVNNGPRDPNIVKRLLNPFTGEWQEEPFRQLHRQDNGAISFSPDMTRVLYVSRTETGEHIELWDLINQKVLWQNQENMFPSDFHDSNDTWLGAAAWAPDSSSIVFSYIEAEREHGLVPIHIQGAYLLDRDGNQGRIITNFSSIHNRNLRVGRFGWSPDGHYLAMSVLRIPNENQDVQKDYRLYLYDLVEDNLIDICWMLDPAASTNRALIWSPDGKYIAYGSQRDIENPPLLNIISINTHEFFQTDMEPFIALGGWSAYFEP